MQVGTQHLHPFLRGHLPRRAVFGAHDGSVVDESIDRAEAFNALLQQFLCAFGAGDVGTYGMYAPRVSQCTGGLGQHIGASAIDDYARAFLQECRRQHMANTGTGAGNHHHPVLQLWLGFGSAHLGKNGVNGVFVQRKFLNAPQFIGAFDGQFA